METQGASMDKHLFFIFLILFQVGDQEQGVMFSPPLETTKGIMVTCLKEIVENTQNFPRNKSSTKQTIQIE